MTPPEFRTRTSCAHQTKLTSPIRTALHHLHLSNPSLSLPLLHRSDSGGLLSESRPNSSHLPLKRALQSNNPRSHFTPRAHFLHSHTITIRSRKRRELPTQKKDSHPRFSSFGILTKKKTKCLTFLPPRLSWSNPLSSSRHTLTRYVQSHSCTSESPRLSLADSFSGDSQRSNFSETLARVAKAITKIPFIGNGDVRSVQDAKLMIEELGVDAVMVGRAATGRLSQSFSE